MTVHNKEESVMGGKILGWLGVIAAGIPAAISAATPAGSAQPHGPLQWLAALGYVLIGTSLHQAHTNNQ